MASLGRSRGTRSNFRDDRSRQGTVASAMATETKSCPDMYMNPQNNEYRPRKKPHDYPLDDMPSRAEGIAAEIIECPAAYYLGIIDILQRWTWWKRLEYWFKVIFLCRYRVRNKMSCLQPRLYAKRFIRMMAHRVLGVWIADHIDLSLLPSFTEISDKRFTKFLTFNDKPFEKRSPQQSRDKKKQLHEKRPSDIVDGGSRSQRAMTMPVQVRSGSLSDPLLQHQ